MKNIIMLLCVGLTICLTGCGESPENVVKKWQSAIQAGDLKEANKYSNSPEANELMIETMKDYPTAQATLKKVSILKSEIEGNKGVVHTTIGPIGVEKISGKWLVKLQ